MFGSTIFGINHPRDFWQFIPNRPPIHVITSTNSASYIVINANYKNPLITIYRHVLIALYKRVKSVTKVLQLVCKLS